MTTSLAKLEHGLTSGALATIPMTAVMLAAQKLGLLGKLPPAKITDDMLARSGQPATRRQRKVLATIAHIGFGAASGALYSLLRPGRPSIGRGAIEGAAFATAVWGASYAGWIPALGILPPPDDDRKDRQITMVVAHWIFGVAVGIVVAARRR
ncbi:MAG: hypothetical protein H0T42_33920 [Deltaproteobacteria bacterium]|nr:hypothetical protein [Deltaproteobacteria bacterium]